jgi:hypothetical protein
MVYNQFNQSVMWKNIFLESCILSALIFGGFYLNTTLLQDELYSEDNNKVHISGIPQPLKNHISGQLSEEESTVHISGFTVKTPQ